MDNKVSEKKNLANGAIWNTIGSLCYLSILFLTNLIVARWEKDGFGDAGVYTLAMKIVNPYAALALYGMRSFQVSDVNSKYTDKEYVLSRIATTSAAFLGCIIYSIATGRSGILFLTIFAFLLYKLAEAFQDVY
ncbi:MAG: hypothetical protein K6G26_12645, partial [Lachnospiraceae bacterium]|nr:hypothetical protein [Lachnospiraceae bacterium]